MVNTTLLWMLVVPLVMSAVSFVLLPKLDRDIDQMQAGAFSVLGLAIASLIMAAAFYSSKGMRTHDIEIWNGKITEKKREHDHYLESYSCNCSQSCSGSGKNRSCSEVCQTCYRDHYTVTWRAGSTLGEYIIDHLDRTSRHVYQTPDPAFYSKIQVGEACARLHPYTNYIKAVPDSLFRPAAKDLKVKFAAMIPAYPGAIYNFWHVDRVLPVGGMMLQDLPEWNAKLADVLKTLGPAKQANAIIVLVKTEDPNYLYALQDAWVGAKKNDIVLVIGTMDGIKPAWAGVLALTDSELFKVKLRDDIMALEALTADSVIGTLERDTQQLFKRKPMNDFAYLDAEIDPPAWINAVTLALVMATYIGFWMFCRANGAPRFMRRFS
jgi:hypothetical protein